MFADTSKPITIEINDKIVRFEVSPFIETGVTLVPFRQVFERIGLHVEWDGEQGRVIGTRVGNRIELTIGSNVAHVNGEEKQLEVAPRIVDGSTFVPLRFVGEAADQWVTWDGAKSKVTVRAKDLGVFLSGLSSGEVTFEIGSTKGTGIPAAGTGKLYDGSGYMIYEGEFANGTIEGKGSLYINGNKRYEGDWRNNRFEGYGKLLTEWGEVHYEGEFKNGKRNGAGKSFVDNKLVHDGQFENDEFIGFGKVYDTNGIMHEINHKVLRDGFGVIAQSGTEFQRKQLDERHNKHQWNVITTKHTRVYSYEREQEVREAATQFDDIFERIVTQYGHLPPYEQGDGKISVYLLKRSDFMSDLNTGDFGGMTYPTRIYLNLDTYYVPAKKIEILRMFAHELTHLTTMYSEDTQLERMPSWYSEGVAMLHEKDASGYMGWDWYDYHLRQAIISNQLLPWNQLMLSPSLWNNQMNIGYAQSRSIVEYLCRTYGEEKIVSLFYQDGSFDELLHEATDQTMKKLESDWKEDLLNRHLPALQNLELSIKGTQAEIALGMPEAHLAQSYGSPDPEQLVGGLSNYQKMWVGFRDHQVRYVRIGDDSVLSRDMKLFEAIAVGDSRESILGKLGNADYETRGTMDYYYLIEANQRLKRITAAQAEQEENKQQVIVVSFVFHYDDLDRMRSFHVSDLEFARTGK
jgi:hypothetical protein